MTSYPHAPTSAVPTSTVVHTNGTNVFITGTSFTEPSFGYTSPALATTISARKDESGRITPKLAFRIIKTKLGAADQKELSSRIRKIKTLLDNARRIDQRAMYENLSVSLIAAIKEQELDVYGYGRSILHADLIRCMRLVKGPNISLTKLENYVRPIPAKISRIIRKCQKDRLFDSYYILHLEYKDKIGLDEKTENEKSSDKTNQDRIREKDPILFGQLNHATDKMFFITDWVDEYCDLTLEKFIHDVREDDPEFDFDKTTRFTSSDFERIFDETEARVNRLKTTNRGNFRRFMDEEEWSYLRKGMSFVGQIIKRWRKK